jgi:phosphoserine phosphatase
VRIPNPPYARVFFDVDSTLVTIEGIDWLADGDREVQQMTSASMEGTIPLEQVYERRLAILRPSAARIGALSEVYLNSLTPGAKTLIDALRSAGSDIHLITGGIEQAILPLAESLGIRKGALHAVRLSFDPEGRYVDFDRRSFLTRSNGKTVVIRDLRARSHGNAALVGDGASDAEAREAVDLFIGFGGVTAREAVRNVADIFIDEPRLDSLVPFLIGSG